MKGSKLVMYKVTSKYLEKESFRSSGHSGVDFSMSDHTPLRAIKDGTVEGILDFGNQNAGKCIKIKFEDGNTGIYGHLSEFANIKEGQHVEAGDLIGYSGNSGHVVGANGGYHLHFGVKDTNGNFINPSQYINDIQHMNDPSYFVQQATEVKMSFFDFMSQHMDLIGGFISTAKLNFIHLISSTDYTPFIKLLQNLIQFFLFNI